MWTHDIRYGLRLFAAHPAFTAVALLTLALGIGATTAIFSVIDTVLLRPTPFPGFDRLVVVWETDRNTGTTHEPASFPDYLDYRQRSRSTEQLSAFLAQEVNYAPEQNEPVRLQALAVTDGLLPMLGVQPSVGRGFTADETRPGGPAVALISDALWTRGFARDPSIVGRTIRIDDNAVSVIGVMPHGADFGAYQILKAADYSRGFADRGARATVDVWLPLQASPESLPRSTHPIFMAARRTTSAGASQTELAAIAADLEGAYRENAARGVFVQPLADIVFGPVRPALLVLLCAVGLVLLVACANVASLLLARGTIRRREVAVRTALGADGWRIVRQFAAEGILLSLLAATLGVAVAVAGVKILIALAPADIPRIASVSIDLRVLIVTLCVSLLAGLAFGAIPALQALHVDLQRTLKSDGGYGASPGRDRGRVRSALVVGEVALAVMLVIGAALLIKSFWRLHRVDAGFRSTGVVKAEYQLPPSRYPVDFKRYPDLREIHAFTHALLQKAAALPGVESVAVAGNHPLDPGFTNSFVVVGREAEARNWPEISIRRVTPGYFKTMEVPLLRGRLLSDSDATTAPAVAVVNQAAAERFFGDRDPLGQRMRFWGSARTIVGVVGNERFHGLTEVPPPAVYTPLDQTPSANGSGALLVRTRGTPAALMPDIRNAIRQQDPALAVFGLEPLDETVGRSLGEQRFTMLVLGLLAAVALLLAAAGIHGVLSYVVSQRTREIGIRMALGAQPGGVLRLVVGQGLGLAIAGAGIGLACAFLLTRAMRGLLFGVTPTDPAVFAIVPLALVGVAVAASYFPARRAIGVNPVEALREG